jgi:hypothetical protein
VLVNGQVASPALRNNRVIGLSDPQFPIMDLLAEHQRKGYAITQAFLVAGNQLDAATIANPHTRVHAREGELFRSALEQVLNAQDSNGYFPGARCLFRCGGRTEKID